MLALVVDNDSFFRELLGEFLGELGHAVAAAADGLEALESVTRTPPDIIFLDLVMPKIGGDRVCAYLKSDPATASIPIVILSATVAEDRAKVMGMGADACIAKLRVEELRTYVQAALESLRGGVRAAPPPPGAVFGVEQALPRGMVVELLAVKRHHEAILAEIAEGVIETDAAGRVVYINPAALRLLGRTERETIGQEFPDLLAPATAAQLREEMDGGQPPRSLSLTVGGRGLLLRASPPGRPGGGGGMAAGPAGPDRTAADHRGAGGPELVPPDPRPAQIGSGGHGRPRSALPPGRHPLRPRPAGRPPAPAGQAGGDPGRRPEGR